MMGGGIWVLCTFQNRMGKVRVKSMSSLQGRSGSLGKDVQELLCAGTYVQLQRMQKKNKILQKKYCRFCQIICTLCRGLSECTRKN